MRIYSTEVEVSVSAFFAFAGFFHLCTCNSLLDEEEHYVDHKCKVNFCFLFYSY